MNSSLGNMLADFEFFSKTFMCTYLVYHKIWFRKMSEQFPICLIKSKIRNSDITCMLLYFTKVNIFSDALRYIII